MPCDHGLCQIVKIARATSLSRGGLRQAQPAPILSRGAGISIAGKIHQVERRCSTPRHAVDIRQSRLAWRRTGAREPLPDERVDQARFTNIRTSHHDDFPKPRVGEVARGGGAYDEISGNLQWVIGASMTAPSTGAACASGVRAVRGPVSAIFRTSSIV